MTVELTTVGRVSCNSKMVDIFKALFREIPPELIKSFGGIYNCRPIRGGSSWSKHAFGTAVDINHKQFPQGSTKRQDPKLDAVFTKYGFVNGHTFKDPMHYEFYDYERLGGDMEELQRQINELKEHNRLIVDPTITAHNIEIAELKKYNAAQDAAHTDMMASAFKEDEEIRELVRSTLDSITADEIIEIICERLRG